MAFDTYATLKTQVATWMGRDDLTSNIGDFITLFEAWVNRRLRMRQQDTKTTLTTSSGIVALPTDYLSWRRLTWTGSTGVELVYRTPSALRELFPAFVTGIPSSFSVEGGNIVTADQDDTTGAFELEYFQKTAALSGALNWLYVAHPDAYLFGTLSEAYAFTRDADAMSLWVARRNAVFDEIETLDIKTRGPSAITIMGPTP